MIQFVFEELIPIKNETLKWASQGVAFALDTALIFLIVYGFIR
jgi:hypothetical protein